MSQTTTIEAPALGTEGEACMGCAAPLAPDQRYCLNCGRRRASARVDVDHYLLAPETASAAGPAAVTASHSLGDRAWTPFAIVGTIAALGAMLLLGVLIGNDKGSQQVAATAPAPNVVVKAPAASGDTTSTPVKDTSSTAGNSKSKKSSGGKSSAGPVADVPAPKTDAKSLAKAGATQLDDSALSNLDSNDTASNARSSAQLPDVVATPGQTEKPDNKPAGGGQGGAIQIGG